MHGQGACESLVEFSFISTACPNMPTAAFLRLAHQTRTFNERMDLTGRLDFVDGRFEMLVEGDCGTVLQLAARILADPRHTSIRITALGAIAERRFSEWTLTGFHSRADEFATPLVAQNLCRLAPIKSQAHGERAASGALGEAG
jgi:Sensors of blue-light using FAD